MFCFSAFLFTCIRHWCFIVNGLQSCGKIDIRTTRHMWLGANVTFWWGINLGGSAFFLQPFAGCKRFSGAGCTTSSGSLQTHTSSHAGCMGGVGLSNHRWASIAIVDWPFHTLWFENRKSLRKVLALSPLLFPIRHIFMFSLVKNFRLFSNRSKHILTKSRKRKKMPIGCETKTSWFDRCWGPLRKDVLYEEAHSCWYSSVQATSPPPSFKAQVLLRWWVWQFSLTLLYGKGGNRASIDSVNLGITN